MILIDRVLCVFCVVSLFLMFCFSYQRNFIICDKLLFHKKKESHRKIDRNILSFEKNLKVPDLKTDNGFVRDVYTRTTLHYYILYNTHFSKTVLFFHGNKGSIDRHLKKCLYFYQNLRMNVIVFDYSGFGKSTGEIRNETDMLLNATAIYEEVFVKKLAHTELFVYGISLGGTCAFAFALYKSRVCRGVVIENGLFSVHELLKNSKWFLLNIIPKKYIVSDFCVEKYLDKFRYDENLPVLLICSKYDKVIPYKNSLKLCEILNRKGFKRISCTQICNRIIGHTNAWKFGKQYYDLFDRFVNFK